MRRETAIVGAALAAVCLFILGLSVLCTWAISEGASPRWRIPFRILCHGMPSRSFELFAAPMPICARCTGIYVGLLVAVIIVCAAPSTRRQEAPRSPRRSTLLLFIAVLPMAVDGLTQAAGLRESTNGLRVVTGLLAAFAFGFWALRELERAVNRRVRGG